MLFEWSKEKEDSNIQKHGTSFVAAVKVFDEPKHIEEGSTKPEYGENRIKTIGMIDNELIIAVISTDRNLKIRIISARRARKNEKEQYYNR